MIGPIHNVLNVKLMRLNPSLITKLYGTNISELTKMVTSYLEGKAPLETPASHYYARKRGI